MKRLVLFALLMAWGLPAAGRDVNAGHVMADTSCFGQGCKLTVAACRVDAGGLTPEFQLCSDSAREVSWDGATLAVVGDFNLAGKLTEEYASPRAEFIDTNVTGDGINVQTSYFDATPNKKGFFGYQGTNDLRFQNNYGGAGGGSTGGIDFRTAGANSRLFVDVAGAVGVNTQTPVSRLEVVLASGEAVCITTATATQCDYGTLATAPATCTVGDEYFDTSVAQCWCSATNTWSVAYGGGTCV